MIKLLIKSLITMHAALPPQAKDGQALNLFGGDFPT